MVKRLRPALALLASAALIGGCGDDGDASQSGADPAALLDRVPVLPDGGDAVAYIDLAAARQALGLPEDAGVTDFGSATDAEREFLFTAGSVLSYLAIPQEDPMLGALDLGQASAAASSRFFGDDSVAVVATTQSFDDVAAALEDEGYERDDDVLVAPQDDTPALPTYQAVAGADGLIAMGGSEEAVTEALGEPAEEPASIARDLMTELDGPVAGAIATPSNRCLEGIAASESLEGASELLLAIDDAASADDFVAEERYQGLVEFGQPEADGDRLRVSVERSDEGITGPPSMMLLSSDLPSEQVYDCG